MSSPCFRLKVGHSQSSTLASPAKTSVTLSELFHQFPRMPMGAASNHLSGG